MATAVRQTTRKQPENYDAYVEGQLERARQRIRKLDLTTAVLGFVAGTLAYAVLMACLDNWLTLSPGALYTAFFVYLFATVVYLGLTVLRPLTRRINPYYAARKVEGTLPAAKNSVVNWLDLRGDQKVPAPIQQAVGQRAAKDVAKADLDAAVSGRRAGWAGGAAAALALLLLGLLVSFGFPKLASHLTRAFLPFGGAAPASRTAIAVVEPRGGNATVAVNQSVTIRARVEGRHPEHLILLTRPTLSDPALERRMEKDPAAHGEWVVTVPALEVKQGFHYRVAGGDAITEEYRIDVRSSPLIETDTFTATYRLPKYVGETAPRVVRRVRELSGMAGTEVTLDVHTNRQLKEGLLELVTDDNRRLTYPAQVNAAEPRAMQFTLVLEQSGRYAIRFTSAEGEYYADPLPYAVKVRPDEAPAVELTLPGKDVSKPADALLELEGVARDDVGVKEISLRMQVVNGSALQPRPYRPAEEVRLADGGYPHVLDYKDFVDLARLKDDKGEAVALKPGDVLEYWLEARDARNPRPNVGESKHYKVTIAEPQRDEKKKEQRRQEAEKEQQQHKKEQDDKLKQESKERKEEAQRQEQKNQEERGKESKPEDGAGGRKEGDPKEESKDGDGKGKTEGANDKTDPPMPEKSGGDKGGDPSDKGKPNEEELKDQFKRLKEEVKKQRQKQRDSEKAEGKSDGTCDNPGEAKGNKASSGKGDGSDKGGGRKDSAGGAKGKPEGQNDPGKEGAKQGGPDSAGQDRGQGKEQGKPEASGGQAAENKDAAGPKDARQARGKDGPPQEQPRRGEGRDKGDGGMEKEQVAENKGAGDSPMSQQAKKSEGKSGSERAQGQQGQPKGQPRGGERATSKTGDKKQGPSTAQGKPAPKDGDPSGTGDKTARAERKPAGNGGKKPENASTAKQDRMKGDDQRAADKPAQGATRKDVERIAKDLDSGDAEKRQEAKRKLEEISQRSLDGEAREAARQELDKHNAGERVAAAKPSDSGKPGEKPAQSKEGPKSGEQNDKAGSGKQGGEKRDGKQGAGKTAAQAPKGDGAKAKGGIPPERRRQDRAGERKLTEKEAAALAKKTADDLKGEDPAAREEARKHLEEAARRARQNPDKGPPSKEERERIKRAAEQLAQDLQSDNPEERKQAEETLKDLLRKGGSGGQDEQRDPVAVDLNPDKSDNRHRADATGMNFGQKSLKEMLENLPKDRREEAIRNARIDPEDVPRLLRLEDKTPPPGLGASNPLPTTAPKRVTGGNANKPVEGDNLGLPPPGYRKLYKEFTRDLSDPLAPRK